MLSQRKQQVVNIVTMLKMYVITLQFTFTNEI